MRSPRSGNAFTLIELLIVVAVIAILAALLFPALAGAKKQANDAKCVSNLRQLGVAIVGYTADHSGMLPGPSTAGVGRALQSTQKTQLIYFLQPYLGLPVATGSAYYPEILHCPSLDRVAKTMGKNWYDLTLFDAYSNNDLPASKQYLSSSTLFGSATSSTQPLRMSGLQNTINPNVKDASGSTGNLSMVPAIREVDSTLKNWPWPVAPTPLHGDHNNCLFLDWHVGRVTTADYTTLH